MTEKNAKKAKAREDLTPEQHHVCWNKGTEAPFSGEYVDCKSPGTYKCVCCGNELFHSDSKFDSGSGWPSFWDVHSDESLEFVEDTSHGMRRVEVICKSCNAHLGHVFEDGPHPTGLRYCINSVSLDLEEEE